MDFFEQAGKSLDFVGRSRWTREDVVRFQNRRLRELVRHAYERVPFYRKLYDRHGIGPGEVNGIEDLWKLPPALRADMQEAAPGDLIASGFDPNRLVKCRTSGSTGDPFTICRTWFENQLLHLLLIRQLRLYGLRWTDLRTSTALGEQPAPQRWNPFDPNFTFLRRAPVNVLATAREILDRLAAIQPDVIMLYPGTLAWVAAEATEEDLRRIRPRFIVSQSETLTPSMRRLIRERFNAPVYDTYGANEFNLTASECVETGIYHVEDCAVIVEILRDGKPCAEGEAGEIYGTALHSFSMPFLRYRLGDVVVRGPAQCPCGAPYSTILRVEGRVVDRFPLPGGGSLHPYHLVVPLARSVTWVRRYQIVQETIDHIRVRVVPMPGEHPGEDQKAELVRLLSEGAGPGVKITVELAAELPPAPSGKSRPYYSLVNSTK
ncbi:MAG: phenylacetate--CoA ligase family protein [Rhodospirillales bacterium]